MAGLYGQCIGVAKDKDKRSVRQLGDASFETQGGLKYLTLA
jgi:hypothetical protein